MDEFQAELELDDEIAKPDRQLAEYRHRYQRARRVLVRDALSSIVAQIDDAIASLALRIPATDDLVIDEEWDALQGLVSQVDRLVGAQVPKTKTWNDFYRHLRFGQGVDLHDIARTDWPLVRTSIEQDMYGDHDPLPVDTGDLAELVAARPVGPVSTALDWQRLSDEDFERLVFNIISSAPGYENAQWLTRTNAPDRGRDLSVERVQIDSLSGTAANGSSSK
jgi:hypothetical protein